VTDMQLLAGALRVGGAHLTHNPDTLAFDLVGRLLHHYDVDDEAADPAAARRRGSDSSPRRPAGLKSLLQQCDAQSTQHSALLPILPCFDPPTAMSVFILEGHSQVDCVSRQRSTFFHTGSGVARYVTASYGAARRSTVPYDAGFDVKAATRGAGSDVKEPLPYHLLDVQVKQPDDIRSHRMHCVHRCDIFIPGNIPGAAAPAIQASEASWARQTG